MKYILIILMLIPAVAMGQFFESGGGGGANDSIGVDTNGDGTVDNYLYPSFIKKGSNVTLTVTGDTITIAGAAGTGTADSIGIDYDGDDVIDVWTYNTGSDGILILEQGTGIEFTYTANDTLDIASTLGTDVALNELASVVSNDSADFWIYGASLGEFYGQTATEVGVVEIDGDTMTGQLGLEAGLWMKDGTIDSVGNIDADTVTVDVILIIGAKDYAVLNGKGLSNSGDSLLVDTSWLNTNFKIATSATADSALAPDSVTVDNWNYVNDADIYGFAGTPNPDSFDLIRTDANDSLEFVSLIEMFMGRYADTTSAGPESLFVKYADTSGNALLADTASAPDSATMVTWDFTNNDSIVAVRADIRDTIDVIPDSFYVDFCDSNSVDDANDNTDGWIFTGETLYIDTSEGAGSGTTDSMFIFFSDSASVQSGNSHVNGWLTPQDTLYIDTTDLTGAGWNWADSAGEPPFWVDSSNYATSALSADSALAPDSATMVAWDFTNNDSIAAVRANIRDTIDVIPDSLYVDFCDSNSVDDGNDNTDGWIYTGETIYIDTSEGAGSTDSVFVFFTDSASVQSGNSHVNAWLTPLDTLYVDTTGGAGGTSDSIGIDSTNGGGSGGTDAYIYPAHIHPGDNMEFDINTDTVVINIDTTDFLSYSAYVESTAMIIDTTSTLDSTNLADGGVIGADIKNQTLNEDDIDTTNTDFVFGGAYKTTSATAANEYATIGEVADTARAAAGDSARVVKLDEVNNPGADKTFTMGTSFIDFVYTAPTDSAFFITASGGFTGDLLHVHQHTGNPSTTNLVSLEADDPDVVPLRVQGKSDTSQTWQSSAGTVEAYMDSAGVLQGKVTQDSAGNSIIATYETITNVGLIGDDTTNFKLAKDSVDAWDNGILLWADGSVPLTANWAAGDFDITGLERIETDTLQVGAQLLVDFAGQGLSITANVLAIDSTELLSTNELTTDSTGTGNLVRASNANMTSPTFSTSMQIPALTGPTTDAEGEMAWDADDDAIEVFSGDESESVLIPIYKHISIPIVLPDSVQAYVADLKVFHVNSLLYPAGIEIDLVSIVLESDAAYSMVIEEWSSADPAVYENAISTVTTGATDTYAEEAPDTDGNLDAGDWIVLDIPTTDVDVVTVEIYFHVTAN